MSSLSDDSKLKRLRLDKALLLVWRSAPGWTLAGMVLLVLQGVLPLLGLYLLKLVIDAVAKAITLPDGGTGFVYIAWLMAGAGGVLLLGGICRSLSNYIQVAQTQAVSNYVYDILHSKAIELDLEYYENPEYYDLLHLARREGTYRPARIVGGLAQIIQNGISLLAMGGLLISFHWAVGAVLVLAAIPGALLRLRTSRKFHKWQRDRAVEERRSSYFHSVLLDQLYAKEIRLFNLGTLFRNRFRDLKEKLRQERIGIAMKQSTADIIGQTGAVTALFGSFTFIAYRTVRGVITIGDMAMYFQALQRGVDNFQQFLSGMANLYEDNLFLSNFYHFLSLEKKVAEPERPSAVPRPMAQGIEFRNVDFTYPNTDRRVLENINLAIRPGEVIGLVGENGSGKTTLVKLLCRFYDPTSGSVTLDGIEYPQFDSHRLRQEISVVFQDYRRFYSSIRENIWLGNTALSPQAEGIIQASHTAGFDSVVAGFAQGYDTVLGKWLENGEELSIGQLQKLALARAFFRNAQLVVLDEPTSAMDAKAEFELFSHFREMVGGRSILLISHRLSSLKMADRIYVLKEGRIVEQGSHDDLVRESGAYARLFETQARAYR